MRLVGVEPTTHGILSTVALPVGLQARSTGGGSRTRTHDLLKIAAQTDIDLETEYLKKLARVELDFPLHRAVEAHRESVTLTSAPGKV